MKNMRNIRIRNEKNKKLKITYIYNKNKIHTILLILSIMALLLILSAAFSSCADKGVLESTQTLNLNIPAGTSLTVGDIRVKGFTVSWTNLSGGDYEYAIAASYNGKIDDYVTALENKHIVLDFTADKILNGTYKVTQLMPGKEYEIKLFARKKNTTAAEYLKGRATLPYIDEAELYNVWFDGVEITYNKTDDSFTKAYIPGAEHEEEYTVTYKVARLCGLYINGVKIENGEFKLKDGEIIEVTVVNERNKAARDYIIGMKMIDNGIPIVMVNTEDNRPITSKSKDEALKADFKIIDSAEKPYGEGLYDGEIMIRGQGNSSLGTSKKSYKFSITDKTQILDMAPSQDWTLLANFTDKSLMRNYIAYELYRDMGAVFSPKLRYVDLVINGEYLGTYNIGERVKIDKGRLDLPKIKGSESVKIDKWGIEEKVPASTLEELNGSYVLRLDSTDKYSTNDIIFETKKIKWSAGHFFSIKQPGEKNMSEEAYNYISDYVNQTENALFSEDFKDPAVGYRAYIDPSTFIDWYIVNELFKQVDANFHTNVYFYKPRGGKLCMGPIWNFDLGAGNADYSGCDDPEGWYVRNASWFTRLFEDEKFANEFKERWNYVKSNCFDSLFKRIDSTAALLERSQTMNFGKWQILGVYVWPNAGDVTSRKTYQSEIDYLKEWLTSRIEWMDAEINK